ncbi:MAG TPA: hypothetical protein VEW28_08980, partial [Candidatus Kapabacteria bacterium]|nr:hypothetical protein [Candidatus Kapabacteria bacterium]
LKPGDTMSMTVCFHSKDTTVHIDTLLLEAPCFHSVVTLVGPGGSPFIYTTDKDFGPIIIGETRCDTMTVRNLGNMSFTVTGILLHDTNHFKIDTSGTSKFPIVVVSGRLTHFSFCFTPDSKALDSTTVDFLTDMEGPYKDSIKSWSFLKGSGVDTTSGVTQTSLEQTQLSAFIEANRLIVHVADNLELGEKFELYDLLGRCVAEWGSVAAPDANGYIVLPMPNVSSGVYLLRVGANSCKVLR